MGFFPATGNQSVTGNLTVSGSETITAGPLTVSAGGLVVGGGGAAITGTGSYTGILSPNAGTNSSGSAPLITPANANGTAAQLTDTTRDYMIYITIGTAGTAFALSIGPTSGTADSILSGAAATSGDMYSFRLPAGWFWKWSATTATLASQAAIGC